MDHCDIVTYYDILFSSVPYSSIVFQKQIIHTGGHWVTCSFISMDTHIL